MKIPKKHAVATTHFILEYLDQDFWPMDSDEAVFIGKVIGFGQYHKIVEVDKAYRFLLDKIGVGRLPAKRSCARLSVEENEANSLIQMIDEWRRFNVDAEEQYESLRRYLIKELIDQTD